jgi:hypothetical protein
MSQRDHGKPEIGELQFKPETQYLTAEGYPLGTTCWYVIAEVNGARKYCCGDTPGDALRAAGDFFDQENKRLASA